MESHFPIWRSASMGVIWQSMCDCSLLDQARHGCDTAADTCKCVYATRSAILAFILFVVAPLLLGLRLHRTEGWPLLHYVRWEKALWGLTT